jgi:tRNA(Arg) A34 adenosine deaminase TadA
MDDRELMAMAVSRAREGISKGQTPFGACIARAGDVVACEHNRVWETTDITAHAEIVAIREACRRLGTVDLSGCVIYATTEPCPMCFSAIHWARIDRLVFGTGISDARDAGFNELCISDAHMKSAGVCKVEIEGGFMRDECLRLFGDFASCPRRRVY